MAATMTTMPRLGDDATPLCDNALPLGACSVTTTPRSGDDANLGNNATPLGARLVMMAPSLKTLGNNTKLGNDSTLCGYGASLGGSLCYIHNPTLGLFSCTF